MKILITGATGGLGRSAVDYLKNYAPDIQIRATGRNQIIGNLITKNNNSKNIEFVPLSLSTASDMELDNLLTGIDVVWHCAAKSAAWGKYSDFIADNITATKRLLSHSAKLNIQCFIHISTPAIYFDYQKHININESYKANKFANMYSATKWQAEQEVLKVSALFPNMRTAIIRPRAIFGEYDTILLPYILKKLEKNNGKLILPNGGNTILDLTYATNVAHAMYLLTQQNNIKSGEIFNISNDNPIHLKKALTQIFIQNMGLDMQIINIPYNLVKYIAKFNELKSYITNKKPDLTCYGAGVLSFDMTLNIEKSKKLLGYKPIIDMPEAIQRTSLSLLNR